MAKTYTRIFSDSGPAGVGHVSAAITIASGKFRVVPVPVPTEGCLTHLAVKQVPAASGGGTSVAFDVELLKSLVPYTTTGEKANGTTAAAPVELYRVVAKPAQTALGNALELFYEYGHSYKNADGTPSLQQDYLYLVIYPNAAGDATVWDAEVQIRHQIGG